MFKMWEYHRIRIKYYENRTKPHNVQRLLYDFDNRGNEEMEDIVYARCKDYCDPEDNDFSNLNTEFCESFNFGKGCKYKKTCKKYWIMKPVEK